MVWERRYYEDIFTKDDKSLNEWINHETVGGKALATLGLSTVNKTLKVKNSLWLKKVSPLLAKYRNSIKQAKIRRQKTDTFSCTLYIFLYCMLLCFKSVSFRF